MPRTAEIDVRFVGTVHVTADTRERALELFRQEFGRGEMEGLELLHDEVGIMGMGSVLTSTITSSGVMDDTLQEV